MEYGAHLWNVCIFTLIVFPMYKVEKVICYTSTRM